MGQNASATLPGQQTSTSDSSPKRLEPPDEPPEKKRSCMISEGRIFTRYYIDNDGVPGRSEVLVSYDKETQCICWSPPDSIRYDSLYSMKIKDISKVLQGKHTVALQTSVAADAPSNFCFSIISFKLHQSIDLEATERATASAFAQALDTVMEQSRAHRARWSLSAPPYQMPITHASISRALNASLIQHSKLRKDRSAPIVRKSKSRKKSPSSVPKSKSLPTTRGSKPKVGKKRKQKCSPVLSSSAQAHVALADLPR